MTLQVNIPDLCRGFFALILLLAFSSFFLSTEGEAKEHADIIVAKDGTGHFTSIQSAIDSVPNNAVRLWIILIKSGTYNEKLFVTKSNITLVGEDRESTRIVYAELRRNWRKDHNDDDWGSAVINIGKEVHDIILANLTVYNNYGAIYGDHDHAFAIRGFDNCTRIITVNCSIMADGGDTMSLWNPRSGMYYHADCFFMGWVDYVCPRGWCYLTDCSFYGYNKTASVWHDGSADSTSKFVIRNSSFDGIVNFPLGRNHKEAQFFLLDCRFSANMLDRPIRPAFDTLKFRWPGRYYYYNCHRDGEDFPWYTDNLTNAYEGPVHESQITALLTFKGQWDPERAMPAVLPFASVPIPRNNGYDIAPDAGDTLRWIGGRNAKSYNIYFGTENPPAFSRNQKNTFYLPGKLDLNMHYYWRVDVVTDTDTIPGRVWEFTTVSEEKESQLQLNNADPYNNITCIPGSDHWLMMGRNPVHISSIKYLRDITSL
jgi:pectinesterase